MNQACHLCRQINSSANKYCSQCGALLQVMRPPSNPSPPPQLSNWKRPAAISALAASAFWVCLWVLSSLPDQPRVQSIATQTEQPTVVVAVTPAAAATPIISLALTAGQHLAEARRALAESEKTTSDAARLAGPIAAARWHLEAVTAKERDYAEAQKLLATLTKRERALATATAEAKKGEAVARSATSADSSNDEESNPSDDSAKSEDASPASAASSSAGETTGEAPAAGRSRSSGGAQGSGFYTNRAGNTVRSPTFSQSAPAGASARCHDGSYSFSQSRRGTCSHHGGVAAWL